MITYRRIVPAGDEYDQEKDLRNRVLRLPLGLELSETDTRGEDGQIHLAAVDEREGIIGCVLMATMGDGIAKVRQMAVDERHRRRGIGTELMRLAEHTARAAGIRKLTMHARLSARSFYERLGYQVVSDRFVEVTIPHIGMEKNLEPEE